MAGLMRCLLLLLAAAVVIAMPPNDQPEKRMEIMTSAARREAPLETFSDGFSKDFAHNLPTQEFMGDFANAEAAKEDSEGFIVGKPDNFPGFHTIGGFGPMADVEKGDVAGNFMKEFKFPAVQIPDINEEQPQFSPEQFQKQVSVVRDDPQLLAQQPQHADSFQPIFPSPPEDSEDGFRLIFPQEAASHVDSDPIPHSPPSPNHIPTNHRPIRPSAPHRGRPKRPNKTPFSRFLNPIRELMRPSRSHNASSKQLFQ